MFRSLYDYLEQPVRLTLYEVICGKGTQRRVAIEYIPYPTSMLCNDRVLSYTLHQRNTRLRLRFGLTDTQP